MGPTTHMLASTLIQASVHHVTIMHVKYFFPPSLFYGIQCDNLVLYNWAVPSNPQIIGHAWGYHPQTWYPEPNT